MRELLTTFRLQLTEPGLRPALEASCEEYSAKFGFPVKLDYQLPPRLVPSHQAIHLLQIAREALSNALKHSQASEVVVTVAQNDNQVKLTVEDNGCGVPENAIRSNHYGMIIMRDRAQSLQAIAASAVVNQVAPKWWSPLFPKNFHRRPRRYP